MGYPSVAVVGCGYWGKNLVRNFHALGALKLICDTDKATLDSFKASLGVETTFSYEEVLNDPSIDAVALATPAEHHFRMVSKALAAGKDVYVEKPISLTREEGRILVDESAKKGRVLMVGHLLHYHGAVIKLKELVRNGTLGRLRYIYSNRLNLGKVRREENVLWSFAPHDVSVILSLAGDGLPTTVACNAGAFLHPRIADTAISTLNFVSGIKAHIHVSWLHPTKEQKLVVVGTDGMAVFDDVEKENKLLLYPHKIDWKDGRPEPVKADPVVVEFDRAEPLKEELRHFLECVANRATPLTDGKEGLAVLEVLQALQNSMDKDGEALPLVSKNPSPYFAHPTVEIDEGTAIGEGTSIWHFSHVLKGSKIGKKCSFGQNCVIGPNVTIGDGVKAQNNISIYEGVTVEDDVFLGPSMVFTNVINPRAFIQRKSEFRKTLLKKGCSVGANATIVCGSTIGRYALIGAGATVTKDVPDFALMVGSPARRVGWVGKSANKLDFDAEGKAVDPSDGTSYILEGGSVREG